MSMTEFEPRSFACLPLQGKQGILLKYDVFSLKMFFVWHRDNSLLLGQIQAFILKISMVVIMDPYLLIDRDDPLHCFMNHIWIWPACSILLFADKPICCHRTFALLENLYNIFVHIFSCCSKSKSVRPHVAI